MIFLLVAFVVGVVILILFFQKRLPETSNLPFPKSSPTSVTTTTEPSLTSIPQLPSLNDDLMAIEKDLEKMKKEDKRVAPPTFIFGLGLK